MYSGAVFDWNDIRHFLAVAETGSTLAAAKVLRVSQPTVVRRIAALEQSLALILFERSSTGYALTAAGEAILAECRHLRTAADRIASVAGSHGRDISGTVRISVFEIFAATFLVPLLGELRTTHPQLRVDLDLSDRLRDIGAGEADIAVRSAVELRGGDLVCRKLVEERWGYFCSRAYAARNGVPHGPTEARSHVIVGDGSEDFWPEFEAWRRQSGIANTIDLHHGAATAVLAAIRSGLGIGLLPHLAAVHDRELVHCFDGPRTGHFLWLVTSARLRHTPRVRIVMDFLADRIRRTLPLSS